MHPWSLARISQNGTPEYSVMERGDELVIKLSPEILATDSYTTFLAIFDSSKAVFGLVILGGDKVWEINWRGLHLCCFKEVFIHAGVGTFYSEAALGSHMCLWETLHLCFVSKPSKLTGFPSWIFVEWYFVLSLKLCLGCIDICASSQEKSTQWPQIWDTMRK